MKPRFKLHLDGCVSLVRAPIDVALARARRESDEAIPSGVYRSIRARERNSSFPEARLRRQILRAYGSLGEFARVGCIPFAHLSEALKPRLLSKKTRAGQLKHRLGLPTQEEANV